MAWLKEHPLIEIVTRDGFTAFRKGITDANSSITQIYDRWHFVRNMKKQLDTHLLSLIPSKVTLSNPPSSTSEIPSTRAARQVIDRQNKKWELIQEIQNEHKKGKNISRLAREYQLDWRTIKKYLQLKEKPVEKRQRKKATDQYKEEILKLELAGHTVKEICSAIQQQGYSGTFSAVRILVQKIRKERKYGLSKEVNTHIPRKKIGTWIWKFENHLNTEESEYLKKCLQLYPSLKELHQTVQIFRKAVQTADMETFLRWIHEQLSSKKQPFYHYAFRIRSDIQAVKNALTFPYSNGLLEGQINRLKTIKRVTYGRAGVSLLEKRVLYRL